MTRDALKNDAWFNEWLDFSFSGITEIVELRKSPPKNPAYEPQLVHDLGFRHMKLLLRRYSLGDPISELAGYFEPLLLYWEESERLGRETWTPEQQHTRHTWSVNLDHYIDCFWLVGLALSLQIPDPQWQRLVALMGSEGEDALLDRIIATRSPSRKIGGALCYPQPYAVLMEAIDAPTFLQPILLEHFLSSWYRGVGAAARSGRERQAIAYKAPYWHSYHEMEGGYFGYWCLEAVAAVKAFRLDDSQCVGHPHYPGDLLRPGVVTPPDMTQLLPAGVGLEHRQESAAAIRQRTSYDHVLGGTQAVREEHVPAIARSYAGSASPPVRKHETSPSEAASIHFNVNFL